MNDKLSNTNQTVFEQNKAVDENGNEFWGARKLSKILEYSEFRHFLPVVERAKEACKNSGQKIADHFEDYLEEISHGKGARQDYRSIKLSRYACYLIVQNADPTKEVVALRPNMQELGGTMPENLPVADSIKKLDKKDESKKLAGKKKK